MNPLQVKKFLSLHSGLISIVSGIVLSVNFSCSHKQESGEKDSAYIADINKVTTYSDTVREPVQQTFTITSNDPDTLINFMQKSKERDRFKQGILPLIIEKSSEYAVKLLNNTYSGFIIIDKSRMKVILYDRFGIEKKCYSMACAKNYGTKHEKGDSRTPEGFFSIEGIYDSTDWLFTDDNGITSKKKGQYGPRFIRLNIPGTTQIGIHGTCAPWSIGGRVSHGCIRIKNENILELVELVEVGMPAIIVPGRKDLEQNLKEGVDIPWIPSAYSVKEPKIKSEYPIKSSDEIVDSLPNADTIATPVIEIDTINHKEYKDSIS